GLRLLRLVRGRARRPEFLPPILCLPRGGPWRRLRSRRSRPRRRPERARRGPQRRSAGGGRVSASKPSQPDPPGTVTVGASLIDSLCLGGGAFVVVVFGFWVVTVFACCSWAFLAASSRAFLAASSRFFFAAASFSLRFAFSSAAFSRFFALAFALASVRRAAVSASSSRLPDSITDSASWSCAASEASSLRSAASSCRSSSEAAAAAFPELALPAWPQPANSSAANTSTHAVAIVGTRLPLGRSVISSRSASPWRPDASCVAVVFAPSQLQRVAVRSASHAMHEGLQLPRDPRADRPRGEQPLGLVPRRRTQRRGARRQRLQQAFELVRHRRGIAGRDLRDDRARDALDRADL